MHKNILNCDVYQLASKSSSNAQLLETINDLAMGLNNGKQVDLLLLCFSKAFDKVSHQRLLLKLSHYGINGLLFDWITDYLTTADYIGWSSEQFFTCYVRSTSGL